MTPSLDLVVQSIAGETPAIRRIVLARADGGSLPAFDAGAHVTIGIPGIGPRKYSLVRTEPAASDPAPKTYTLGIRRDDNGGGGSIFMHSLKPGALLNAEPPKNDFPLKIGAAPVALVGGGIGITPLISMAAELAAKNHPYTLVYAARTRSELAFLADLERIAGPNLTLHLDDTASRIFDMLAHFKSLPPETQVYMCGPKPMLKAGMDAAKQLGWPRTRLAFELFYSAAASSIPTPPAPLPPAAAPAPVTAPENANGSFEIVLKSSGKTFIVPPGKSIVDVLVAAGLDPIFDCNRGECGVCQTGVLEGIPDHRDVILSDSERAQNKVMQICISRAKSARLVLDL